MYRLTFSKTGKMRFVGHLDSVEVFRRAVRRSGLPVKYSEGFNPHMELKVAFPLSLGMEGLHEYMDIVLIEERDENEITAVLNPCLPEGLKILKTEKLPAGTKSSAALLCRAEYTVTGITDDAEEKINNILNQNEIYITKKSKKGEKTIEIRRDIFELKLENGIISMTLSAGGERNLSPALVMETITKDPGNIVRKKLILITELN